eukprot:3858272-Amphidinium_carterae.1
MIKSPELVGVVGGNGFGNLLVEVVRLSQLAVFVVIDMVPSGCFWFALTLSERVWLAPFEEYS